MILSFSEFLNEGRVFKKWDFNIYVLDQHQEVFNYIEQKGYFGYIWGYDDGSDSFVNAEEIRKSKKYPALYVSKNKNIRDDIFDELLDLGYNVKKVYK